MAVVALSACGNLRDRRGGDDEPVETPLASPTPWEQTSQACVDLGNADDCDVPGYGDRPFSVYVPQSYDAEAASMPLVVFLHGGGGNAEQTQRTTCPGGNDAHEDCLHELGEREGFITVYPNGSASKLLPTVRTWNAGGGGDYACSSGRACDKDVDDISYLNAVLDEVEAQYRIDTTRVYVMGFSNGGAMSHRIGCEMSDRVAAVAPVSGAFAFITDADCEPSRPMPVIYTHGTEDQCWTFNASTKACLDHSDKPKYGAIESAEDWARLNGCTMAVNESIPDIRDDETSTTRTVWSGCDGDVEVHLLAIDGGGHTFPGGNQLAPGNRSGGSTTRDWNVELLWEFLAEYSL